MIRREVVLSPEASAHLLALYDWIADRAAPATALGYIERLEDYVRGFDLASEHGSLRNEIREGLRTVGFERRITTAFTVTEDQVSCSASFTAGRIGKVCSERQNYCQETLAITMRGTLERLREVADNLLNGLLFPLIFRLHHRHVARAPGD